MTLVVSYWAILMVLIGHSSEIFACRFDPTGQHIASGSMDRSISQFLHSHTELLLIN
jgi:WD40 repeat protein